MKKFISASSLLFLVFFMISCAGELPLVIKKDVSIQSGTKVLVLPSMGSTDIIEIMNKAIPVALSSNYTPVPSQPVYKRFKGQLDPFQREMLNKAELAVKEKDAVKQQEKIKPEMSPVIQAIAKIAPRLGADAILISKVSVSTGTPFHKAKMTMALYDLKNGYFSWIIKDTTKFVDKSKSAQLTALPKTMVDKVHKKIDEK